MAPVLTPRNIGAAPRLVSLVRERDGRSVGRFGCDGFNSGLFAAFSRFLALFLGIGEL